MTTIINSTSRLAAALVLALLGGLAATVSATAAPASHHRPVLTVNGSSTWAARPHGDVVVNGRAEVTRRSGATRTVELAAVIGPDDRTMPSPGECERAVSTLTIYDRGRLEVTLIGDGDVCGHHPQPPTSIVTHVFTGRYEVLDTTRRQLAGTDGFFEVRLATDGTASAFAIDT